MCTSPILIKAIDGGYRRVSCGRCCECLSKYQNSWKARLMFERMAHKTPTYFVTLTYSDEHLPYVLSDEQGIKGIEYKPIYMKDCSGALLHNLSPDGEMIPVIRSYVKEYTVYRGADLANPSIAFDLAMTESHSHLTPTVYHKDLQDWIKRNRIATERALGLNLRADLGFAYFFTSEYGPKHLRPHYHGLIYGLDRKTVKSWCDDWTAHFGRESNKKVNVTIEEVRGDGASNYVSKYCSKGFYDHPFCSKQITISSFIYEARVQSFKDNGYYLDRSGQRVYSEPALPKNYRCAPRVLDTFHLVSKGLGLEYGVKHLCNSLGCSSLLDGVDFRNQIDLAKLKTNIYAYFRKHFTQLSEVSISEMLDKLGLSQTPYYERPVGYKNGRCLFSFRGRRTIDLVTDEGAQVVDRIRKFTVLGVDKNGKPKNYSYLLPRYFQAYFLPEGSFASLSYSTRLAKMAAEKFDNEYKTLLSTGQSPAEAYCTLYRREYNERLHRLRQSYKQFCSSMDALTNSSLNQ